MATRQLVTKKILNLSSDPLSGSAGELYFNTSASALKVYDGSSWSDLGGTASGGITVSDNAPSSPDSGQLWFNSSTTSLFLYYDNTWVNLDGGSGPPVYVANAAPSNPSEGDLWLDSDSSIVYVYTSSNWTTLSSNTNSFETISVPNGTSPVADSATDTLAFTNSNGIIISGTASADTIDFSTNATSLNNASTIVYRDTDKTFDITGIDFDTSASATTGVARLQWDEGEGTLTVGLKGGNVSLQVGQENVALCYNGTGTTIANGSVVYISSAQGQRPSITLAQANSETTSTKVFGIATESIANEGEGFVATFGIVNGLNTSSFNAGQALWLSPTVAGGLTSTKPVAPNHSVFVGYAISINSSSGRIFVNPQNGYEIDELHDVLITGIADNNILSYNSASSVWINQALVDAIKEVDGSGSGIDSDLLDGQHGSYYAPVNSPSLTGTPTAPTAALGTNTTQIATTAFVLSNAASTNKAQTTEPTGPTEGVVWLDTDGDSGTVSGYPTVIYSPTEPTGLTVTDVGTIWVDESNISPIENIVPAVIYQSTEPTGLNQYDAGTMWVDSDDTILEYNMNDYVLKSEIGNIEVGFNPFLLAGM